MTISLNQLITRKDTAQSVRFLSLFSRLTIIFTVRDGRCYPLPPKNHICNAVLDFSLLKVRTRPGMWWNLKSSLLTLSPIKTLAILVKWIHINSNIDHGYSFFFITNSLVKQNTHGIYFSKFLSVRIKYYGKNDFCTLAKCLVGNSLNNAYYEIAFVNIYWCIKYRRKKKLEHALCLT